MFDAKTRFPIHGKVVWIHRHGINKGYGVAFGENPQMQNLKEVIENNIADLMAKRGETLTI